MVKRLPFLLLLIAVLLIARPAAAQDFSRLDLMFGYGNYGVEDVSGNSLTTSRVNGFVMHTDINLTSYFTFENITGAYKHPGDITMITNTFGVKLIARDVLDGRISPYVGGGFGIGYYQLNSGQGSFSTTAMRYAVGVDLNMSDAAAIRLDFGGMRVGQGLVTGQGQNNAHVAVGLVFSLGGN